ncbi:unnamed protein product [Pleuronectes platessa]|uniref:Uncharacterized protein n=1 Tax=Pleuronectes platessa TaxID=8262 RepID=A0A9N7Z780_PLEPL|nr:unnamed protein product [Pleuronectes platessa]
MERFVPVLRRDAVGRIPGAPTCQSTSANALVMAAKYFSGCIPVIGETSRSAERARTGGTTDSNKPGSCEAVFFCMWCNPPPRSERDTNEDDVTAQRDRGTEFHSGPSNATPR